MKVQPGNFGFLEAERYFHDDPNTCLIKLRQFAELLAQLIAAKTGLMTRATKPRPICFAACALSGSYRRRWLIFFFTACAYSATTPLTARPGHSARPSTPSNMRARSAFGFTGLLAETLHLLPGHFNRRQRPMRLRLVCRSNMRWCDRGQAQAQECFGRDRPGRALRARLFL
jgi:hypothetical protein